MFTEDTLVQQTAADYLRDNLGWESVYAYNTETFGPEGTLGRKDDTEVILTRYLYIKLMEFNPGLPDEAYSQAVWKIKETSTGQGILGINREKYELFKNGVQVSFYTETGQGKKQNLRIFNFEKPEENHFLCVRELWVRGYIYRRRPDIIGFVNGIPLMFIECKNIDKDLRLAYEGNFKDYINEHVIPHLFYYNAFVIFINGTEGKIGVISGRFNHFHEWKRLEEEAPGAVDMETLLKGVCSRENFMDLFENFILFDDSPGKTIKILARNHQFLGVNRAVKSVEEKKSRLGKLGVFWHTQGAGKSYSMVFFTRKIHRKLGGNYTFLICTDRDDLDTQIYKTFAGCGLADNDKEPCRAESNQHLAKLLKEHKSYIFTLIQKFNKDVEKQGYSHREDIIVITDEAHRTQYGILALNMRNALPNAGFIGFTGTPLFKDDEITRRIFGEYISTYDFQRAVDDKATVPLYYDARGDKLGISTTDINEKLAGKLEEFEIDDIDTIQRLEKDLKGEYPIITADKRLEQAAKDFTLHFSTAWESGKAMFVCIDKITCVKMYNLIQKYWAERIRQLEKDLKKTSDQQEEIYITRQTAWMKETQMAVVVSEEQGEVEKFKNRGLDILPHRILLKQGLSIPEHLRTRPEYKNIQGLDPDSAFKEESHPFRIAIVCAMWLTGFDVPCLSTLYLDKPLKAHTLMQAIARANRVYEGKNNGLIVDYCGILKNLRKALAEFAGQGTGRGGHAPAQPDEKLLELLEESVLLAKDFLEQRNASLTSVIEKKGIEQNAAILEAKEAVNENDETRKKFEIICREVFKKFKACINIKQVNKFRNEYKALNIIYKSLQKDRDKADISEIMTQLHNIVNKAVETSDSLVAEETAPFNIADIDFDRLKAEFQKSPAKKTTVQNLKQAVEKRLRRMLKQNPMRTDFQKYFENIILEYNREKDRADIEKTFEELLKLVKSLDKEEDRAVQEGLDQESLAIYDLLKKPDLKPAEIEKIKQTSQELLSRLKQEKLKTDHWREKETARDAVHLEIKNFLWDEKTGLPVESYTEDDVYQKTDDVFRHIFQAYPQVPSPYFTVDFQTSLQA
ncbi:Type I restriction enzyme R protein [Desulfonema limicola]|uniref:Type I restriction enzyme endonuclease subunit n=1 Tax=Desulfonema limicola TaxID=45656 RepID=A0A975GFR9_9BACT|nr:type I restriction endonuclease subunit R [Desulfonema limicola]QTA79455.1 Type I restriction enzyme R protein [Desulfonema limicola]